MRNEIDRIVLSEDAIQGRVAAMADEIVASYPRFEEGLTIVCILSGSIIFLADLIRRLPMKVRIGLVAVSSYRGQTTLSRGPVLTNADFGELQGRDVLIVDDILDTGGTLRLTQGEVRRAGARDVKTAVLLRKRAKAPPDVPVEFVGFDIEDDFVVGYGLDFGGHYRNLPYIAVLKPEVYHARQSR